MTNFQLTSVAPTYKNVPAVMAITSASIAGLDTLLIKTPAITPNGPTMLYSPRALMIVFGDIDVFRQATSKAIDSAGWWSAMDAASMEEEARSVDNPRATFSNRLTREKIK